MHLFASLRPTLVLLVLAALPAAAPAAQTCAGTLGIDLAFEDSTSAARVPLPTLYHVESTGVRRQDERFQFGGHPILPLDSLAAHPEQWAVEHDDLGTIGDRRPTENVMVRTYCGYYLIRFTLTPEAGGEPTVIDVYNVPPHLPYRLDAPLVVRPGHVRLDISESRWSEGEPPYRILPTAAFERLEE